MTPEERAIELLAGGYHEVERWQLLAVGQRVRHSGQQYSAAYDHGTATITRIFRHPDSAWSRKYRAPDVELIVTRDDGTAGYWANYHTIPVRSEP